MADHRDDLPERLDDATLARYLSGACGPAESARVEDWLEADPANRAELAAIRAAWNPAPVPEADPDDRMWQWIAARMNTPLSEPALVRESEAPRIRRPYRALPVRIRRWSSIAAALVLAAAGGLLWQLSRQSHITADVAPPVAVMWERVTSRGERATSYLPDGSRIVLAPDSRLQIAAAFATGPSIHGPRDVYLQGEAFFEVTHDSARPFRVHTASGVVEDLGTEFVVTAYPETRTTRVVVASGVVAVRGRGAGGGVTLEAGDLGHIDTTGAATLTRDVDVSAYVGWTKGRLVFDEVPLQDAITRLGRWYDLDIRLADTTLARRRLTATFYDEPVSQVLRVLEIALDARAQRTGQLLILRPLHPAIAPSR